MTIGMHAESDNPRVTRLGRFMRRWSLDELPQLINVAAGDMSLVDPRPLSPQEANLIDGQHKAGFNLRYNVRQLDACAAPQGVRAPGEYLCAASWAAQRRQSFPRQSVALTGSWGSG